MAENPRGKGHGIDHLNPDLNNKETIPCTSFLWLAAVAHCRNFTGTGKLQSITFTARAVHQRYSGDRNQFPASCLLNLSEKRLIVGLRDLHSAKRQTKYSPVSVIKHNDQCLRQQHTRQSDFQTELPVRQIKQIRLFRDGVTSFLLKMLYRI
jgi:hypothetical protein